MEHARPLPSPQGPRNSRSQGQTIGDQVQGLRLWTPQGKEGAMTLGKVEPTHQLSEQSADKHEEFEIPLQLDRPQACHFRWHL